MKKMLVIIVVLVIILIGMMIYKNNLKNNSNTVTIGEVEKIENYISKLYMWKEITQEALPAFETVNEAPDRWIWEVVKKEIEEYEVSYETIEEKTKEIFGEEFTKEFPKEGNQSFLYDEATGKYVATEIQLDGKEDNFLLNQIKKTKEGYETEVIEYILDYSEVIASGEENSNISIQNLVGEEIGKVKSTENETNIQQIVKDNINKFSKKKIELVKKEDKLVIKNVKKES